MSIRGPQALASLEDAMRDIRREEDEVSKRVARASERLSKTREHEAELFRQLARLRLDPTVQGELDDRISGAEAKARDMLKAHAKDVSKAEKAISALDARRAELAERRAQALAQLEEQQAQLTALTQAQTARLAADPDFVAQRAETEELDRIAEQSMRKTEQAEADREEKGRPYRDDPLFMYLWEAGYGTSAYKAGNLTRYLDSLVADLVGFARARPNYAMLNEIPLRLREHAELQEANVTAAEAKLAALEAAAVDAAGGKPVREAIARAQVEIETIDAEITAVEDQRDAAAATLQSLAEGRDPAFEGAANDLAAALAREDIQTLLAEARQTRTGQDDTIVAQIDDVRARMREEQEESREQQERLKTLAARRRELEDIQWEFKKQRFDDPGSSFREDRLVGDLLNDFLRGGISAASYWDQWRKSQNWAPGSEWGSGYRPTRQSQQTGSNNPWPPSGGGFQWPDSSFGGSSGRKSKPSSGGFGGGWGSGSSGGSSGGGFSRPRTGSSGTRKHGGFKTGGGF
jgi:DNA repair exonuclease SbcCD ATPase subunit